MAASELALLFYADGAYASSVAPIVEVPLGREELRSRLNLTIKVTIGG